MSPMIAKRTFNLLSKANLGDKELDSKVKIYDLLSDREIEVLNLLIEGYNYKSTAEKLFISSNTVKKHISHIYEKLHVSSKAQVINLMNKS